MKSRLILVGGFLGAGKTSLIWEMAKKLNERHEKVGLITNDQASELVDTAFLQASHDLVKEVSGSCFCCNFNGFMDAVSYVSRKNNGGVILAEPVGSCTDLSATILQPIKDKYSKDISLAPLTVLADPFKLMEVMEDASSAANYIILKQFEEADIILINKTDLLSDKALSELKKAVSMRWENTTVMSASVKTGEGLDAWLDEVLTGTLAGQKIAEVDYDIYAAGEAAFGWLNATFEIKSHANFENLSKKFLMSLADEFDSEEISVGHVKFLLRTRNQLIIGNITGKSDTAELRIFQRENDTITLTVNARAQTGPDQLETIILRKVEEWFKSLDYKVFALKCLIPGRPNPTYRYDEVK